MLCRLKRGYVIRSLVNCSSYLPSEFTLKVKKVGKQKETFSASYLLVGGFSPTPLKKYANRQIGFIFPNFRGETF